MIEHGTRRVRVLGATENPVESWVVQQARNLLMDLEDTGMRVKFVLHDRDASFTAAFDAVFKAAGARVVRSAVQAPRMGLAVDECGADEGCDEVLVFFPEGICHTVGGAQKLLTPRWRNCAISAAASKRA